MTENAGPIVTLVCDACGQFFWCDQRKFCRGVEDIACPCGHVVCSGDAPQGVPRLNVPWRVPDGAVLCVAAGGMYLDVLPPPSRPEPQVGEVCERKSSKGKVLLALIKKVERSPDSALRVWIGPVLELDKPARRLA